MRVSLFIISLFFIGCTVKQSTPLPTLQKSLHVETNSLYVDTKWWEKYHQEHLNTLVNRALVENIEIKKGKLSLKRSLLKIDGASIEKLPSLSGSGGTMYTKNTSIGGHGARSYSSRLGLSYQVDLWGKLEDKYQSSIKEYNATKEELEALKLTIINKIINAYFNISYLNDAYELTKNSYKNYKKLSEIVEAKYEYGRADNLDMQRAKNTLANSENALITLNQKKQNVLYELKNLLHVKKLEDDLIQTSLVHVNFLHVDDTVPLERLLFRPDLKAKEERLKSSFLNQKAVDKSLYPTLNIGASLSSSSENSKDGFRLNIFGNNISIDLPFLDYARVKNSINISKLEYEAKVLEFEGALSEAVNELELFYSEYKTSQNVFKVQNKRVEIQEKITALQEDKYKLGRASLENFLEASNALLETKKNLIYQKYIILQNENRIFQALGGRVEEN